jgi:hypothetical protein
MNMSVSPARTLATTTDSAPGQSTRLLPAANLSARQNAAQSPSVNPLFLAQKSSVAPEIQKIIKRAVPPFADATKSLQAMQKLVQQYTRKAAASPLGTLSASDQRAFESAAATLKNQFAVSAPTTTQRSQFAALQKYALRIPIAVANPKPAVFDRVPTPTSNERDLATAAKVGQQATNAGALLPNNSFREKSPTLGGGVAVPGYTRLKTAAPAVLPIYASNNADLPKTYITAIDLKKVTLKQLVTPATSGATASPANPRPEYINRTASQWNTVADQSGRALAVFNTQYFDADATSSTLSLPTYDNGKVISGGKAEKGGTVALVWNNSTGTARIGQATIDPRLINDKGGKNYLSYQAATRALDLKKGDNALVGFDPEKLSPDTVEEGGATYVGVTAQGKILVLSTNTSMTRAKAAAELRTGGAVRVMMLDSGPSSFMSARSGDGSMQGATWSNRNRLVPAAAAVYAR